MKRVEQALGSAAAAIVDTSVSHRRLTVALSVLLMIGSVYSATTWLEVDTDSSRLLSEDRPVGKTNRALIDLFPSLQDNIVVMIEADETDDARDVALELRDLLAAEPERYPEVFLPGYGDYYDDFGIYHLEREELDELAARLDHAGELLATLADRSEVPVLLGALAHVISSEDGIDSLGDEGRRIIEEVTRTRSPGRGSSCGIMLRMCRTAVSTGPSWVRSPTGFAKRSWGLVWPGSTSSNSRSSQSMGARAPLLKRCTE
jgi:hypothetical protein